MIKILCASTGNNLKLSESINNVLKELGQESEAELQSIKNSGPNKCSQVSFHRGFNSGRLHGVHECHQLVVTQGHHRYRERIGFF